ncbi:MAG: hypothetical protein QOG67_188 [Verrucomicrobiota bacterium]
MENNAIKLYRAVCPAELNDFEKTGLFNAGPNSYEEAKCFAESAEDAVTWGKELYGKDTFHVMEVVFTAEDARRFEPWRLDARPARVIDLKILNALKPKVTNWTP